MLWKGLIWKNSQEPTGTKEHTNSIDPLFSLRPTTMNLAKTRTLRCFVTQTTACTIFMPLPFAQNAALDFHHHFPENWKKKPFCHTLIICLGHFPTSPEFDYSFCKSEAFVSWMNLRSYFQLCLSPFCHVAFRDSPFIAYLNRTMSLVTENRMALVSFNVARMQYEL